MADLADALLVEANLRQAMSFYAGSNAEGRIHYFPGLQTVFSGRNYPVFNVALLDGRRRGNLQSEITSAVNHFRSFHSSFCFWMCHELVEQKWLNEIRHTVLPSKGFHRLSEPPGMLLNGPPGKATRRLPELEFRRVETAASRTEFCHLTSVIFEIPFAMATAMYGADSGWTEEYEGWIGYERGHAVCLALIAYSGGTAGLYSIGVAPHARNRGLGEAMVRWCLAIGAENRKVDRFVLQSTDAGLNLYKRLGFKEVAQFTVYKSRER